MLLGVMLKGAYIFDFDRCSGVFSNKFHIPLIEVFDTFPNVLSYVGALSFSPNGQYLYSSWASQIHQFDLAAMDIIGSKVLVAEFDTSDIPGPFITHQLAPDGKIYISKNAAGHI